MLEQQYQLEMIGISKRFGGVQALKSVDLKVKPGEIHALMGENGAGKSTLIRVLAGVHAPEEGEIYLHGKKADITSTKSALENGIAVIYQEFALAGDLTVAENIFINELNEGKLFINKKRLNQRAKELLTKLGFGDINAKERITQLSVAYQQVVEICKALSRDSQILVLDEPTALLSSGEVEKLFELLFQLKNKGVSIIYISHRLDEIFEIADRITVLKDGSYVGTVNKNEVNDKQLVNMMIGRDLNDYFVPRNVNIGKTVLRVEGINNGNMVKDISFEVKEGEVLGLAGLVGSGRTETVRTIFGVDKMTSGSVCLFDCDVNIKSSVHAIKLGLGLLPEDRKDQGILLELPIRHNTTVSSIRQFTKLFGWIDKKEEADYVHDIVKKLNIKIDSIEDVVMQLSGGNQQKVAIAKILAAKCRVLIFDEPTRGVDVGSKIEIYKIINALAEQGCAIIMVSSEMVEIIGMCDRALVMRNGSIAGEVKKEDLCEERLINYAMGVET